MAVYHCSIKEPLSRGKGKSLIRKAAYNGRTQLLDERTGETTKNYAYKGGLIESFVTFDPKSGAPDWMKTDPQRMLTAAVLAEKRKDSREGQEIVFGFIHELGLEKNRYMLNDFLREQFTRGTGRVAFVAIHEPSEDGDERNMHAHVLLMPRVAGPEGFGERLPALEPKDYERIRQKWAEKGAKELRKLGKDMEQEADRYAVGHLALDQQRQAALERGDLAHAETLNRPATKHRGPAVDAMEKQGMETERGNAYRDTEQARKNNEDLKIELAKVQQAIADYERKWADNLAKAAIAKEQAAGQQEKEQRPPAPAAAPPPPAMTPPLVFGTIRQDKPAPAAKGVTARISHMARYSETTRALLGALDQHGICLARVSKDEAEQSHRTASFAREVGNTAPVYRDGEIVAVTLRGTVHRLNERTTGQTAERLEKHFSALEYEPLKGLTETRAGMLDRAEKLGKEITAERMERATNIKDYSYTFRKNAQLPIKEVQAGAAFVSRIATKAFDVIAGVVEGLMNFFLFDGPKTKEQVAISRADNERSAHVAQKARAADQAERGKSLYASEHERITHRLEELRALDEQRRKDYQRQRGDDHDRDR